MTGLKKIRALLNRPNLERKNLFAPSILSADMTCLSLAIKDAEQSGADLIHIDIMDGVFVPSISFGPQIVNSVKRLTKLPVDVHLMTINPDRHVNSFVQAGADLITFHLEATFHANQLVKQIQRLNVAAGVAINPATPISAITEIATEIDLMLIMTVNPGFAGQDYLHTSTEKINQADHIRKQKSLNYAIEVDGGINADTIAIARSAGADIFVAGSAFYNNSDSAIERSKLSLIKELKQLH